MIWNRYVLGFAFDEAGKVVVLIRKLKPAWQAGKFNGVGGKVEPGETNLEAMVREFKEETTVETSAADWRQFAYMGSKDWSVDVFCAFSDKFFGCRTNTPEQIAMFGVDHFGAAETNGTCWAQSIIPNLTWLIPMALQSKDDVSFAQATVQYFSVSDVE
jgi:8-oxo-dGTP diphosphatase